MKRMETHGTARWADAYDLQDAGMLNAANGLRIGYLTDNSRPGRMDAVRGLFNPKISSYRACMSFLHAFFGKPPREVPVRLGNRTHCGIFSPTGMGKTTAFAINFLREYPG